MDAKESMQRSELFLVLTERKNDLPKQQPKTEGKSTSMYNLPKCFNLLVLKQIDAIMDSYNVCL